MNYRQTILGLFNAAACVALTLMVTLFSAIIINWAIAPLLVDATKQLMQVEWQQLANFCYFTAFLSITGIALAFAIKFYKR